VCEFDALASPAEGRQRHHALVVGNLPPTTATGGYLAVAVGGGPVTLVRAAEAAWMKKLQERFPGKYDDDE
jgi:hypothetical protein